MGTQIEDQPIPMAQFEEESSTNSSRIGIQDHEKLVDESSNQGLHDASSLTVPVPVPVPVVGVSDDYNAGSNEQLHDQLDSDSGMEGLMHDAGKDNQVSAQDVAVTNVKPARIKVGPGESISLQDLNRVLIDTSPPFESVKEEVSKFGGIVDWNSHDAGKDSQISAQGVAITYVKPARIKVGDHPINSEDDLNRVLIDTSPPFESVKDEVSKFGGIVDWNSHKVQTAERRESIEQELEKVQQEIPLYKEQSEVAKQSTIQLQNDLESTKRLIEDLKLNLERAQTEERQAQQNSELAHLRVKEMEERIANETETQMQEAKTRDDDAISDLKTVKNELQTLRIEYAASLTEKYAAEKKAEESDSILRDVEKTVEELTAEMLSTKEALEFAQAAHLEAEERRVGEAMAKEKDCLACDEDLKQAKEDLENLNEQINKDKDLKSKLNSASTLVANLKTELADYSVKEKAIDEVECLKVAATSLKEELEKEKLELDNLRQRDGMASTEVASLESELERIKSDIAVVKTREKEARETMTDLPEELEQASREADEATSLVELAREELKKAKEEVEQAKAEAKYMEIRLTTAQNEIDAARASERLEQESPRNDNGVVISVEKYNELSKQANEAEEEANMKVATAMSQIEVAREKELRSLAQLEEAYQEVEHRKEALRIAMEKAVKAKEGKERVENELRKWRGENEEQTGKIVDEGQGDPGINNPESYSEDSDTSPRAAFGQSNTMKKKKKSLFPRFFMFFARRKSSSKT